MLAALDDAKARRRDARPLQPQGRDLVRRDLVAGRQGEDVEWIDATLIDGVGATEGPMALQVSRRGQTGAAARFIPLAETRYSPRMVARSRRFDGAGPDCRRRRRVTGRLLQDPEKTARRSVSSTASAMRSSATGASGIRTARCSCWAADPPAFNTGGEKVYRKRLNTSSRAIRT